jgi:VWFA-related protein
VFVAALSFGVRAAQFPSTRGQPVRLDVSVTRGDRPVPGFAADDFSIADNGVRQRVESVVSAGNVPLTAILVLDTSGSMAGDRLQHLVEAAHGLVGVLHADDRAALISFDRLVRLRVPPISDRLLVQTTLATLTSRGPTGIRDAVWTALQLSPDDGTRPLVLVFTDGVDNASWLSSSQVLDAARQAGVLVHGVGLGEASLDRAGPRPFLESLAETTGGRYWPAASARDLPALFAAALVEMRARYVVSFHPEGVEREGWHDVKVSANGGGDVRTRPGYLAMPGR